MTGQEVDKNGGKNEMTENKTNENTNGKLRAIEIVTRVAVVLISLGMIYWYLESGFLAFGNIIGILFFTITGAAAVLFDPIKKFIKRLRRNKAMKIILDIIFVLLILFCIYCAAAICLMINGANNPPEEGSTLIVLGCQVRGTEPSHTLRMRLDAAYDYLKDHPDSKAVLSGGQGEGENMSEAKCMYDYLTSKGIDQKRLFMEDRSTTTQENIRYSKEIIEKEGLNPRFAVVTDWYHEFRAGIICDRQGIEHGAVSADTAPHLTAHLVTREILAIPNEILFKR